MNALAALAEDPDRFTDPPDGSERVVTTPVDLPDRLRALGLRYRALVRARWEEAVRLGRPGLAVQARYGSSAPILRALGLVEVATVHTLQS